MIYGDSPSFDEMIEAIKKFVARINQMEWKMKTNFPIPKTNR